jgi:hypothetical protein
MSEVENAAAAAEAEEAENSKYLLFIPYLTVCLQEMTLMVQVVTEKTEMMVITNRNTSKRNLSLDLINQTLVF